MIFKRSKSAFTLIELLIYSGILVISAGLIGGIFYTISKANLKTQAQDAVNNQMASLEEILRQNIGVAKGVNSFGVGGNSLELNMGNSTTTFSLNNNIMYLQQGGGNQLNLNDVNKVKVTSLTFTPTGASGAPVSDSYHYAWNDQVGWLDWAYPGGNVQVPIGQGDLNGGVYVLSDGSWISLNCSFTDSCSTVQYKVSSDANGTLSGWAWSENYGWISFNCSNDNSCLQSNYAVTVSTSTGVLEGYAYSENIGWISLNCDTGGTGGTDICSTSNYRVQDLRMNTSAVKVDITLQYNSTKPDQQVTRSNSFVFNIVTPTQ
jgi:type II secretory pathway pseudopilin PulG